MARIMTYDHELTLISLTYTADKNGVERPAESRTTILCNKKSAGGSEREVAGIRDINPAYVFTVKQYEYDGQQQVEFVGAKYDVYDTYEIGTEEIELKTRATIGGQALKTSAAWASEKGIELLDYAGFDDPAEKVTEGEFYQGMAKSRFRLRGG